MAVEFPGVHLMTEAKEEASKSGNLKSKALEELPSTERTQENESSPMTVDITGGNTVQDARRVARGSDGGGGGGDDSDEDGSDIETHRSRGGTRRENMPSRRVFDVVGSRGRDYYDDHVDHQVVRLFGKMYG